MDDSTKCNKGAEPIQLLKLAGVLLKVGSTGFGGAMPMLALVQSEYVEKRRWVSQEEFDEAVMVGQIMPGPIVVDAVTHMGYRLRGWLGALVSVIAFIIPSFLLMLALTLVYMRYGDIPHVVGIFKGLGAAVVAIIATAAWRMGKPHLKNIKTAFLMLAAMLALLFLQANVVLLVILAGLTGMALFRKPSDLQPGQKPGGRNLTKGGAR
ncbi:MAG: chromate transporter [Deltaproteobacteria bacterium]|nr:chromate transporter [Deltaproteobacteria bacterium]